jgi:hypothetical protein
VLAAADVIMHREARPIRRGNLLRSELPQQAKNAGLKERCEGADMRKVTRVGVVLGGYAGAIAVSCVLVYIRQSLTAGPLAQAASGM